MALQDQAIPTTVEANAPVVPPMQGTDVFTGQGIKPPTESKPNMDDLSLGYLSGIKNKDPRILNAVAEQARGTPLGEQANDALSIMNKNVAEATPLIERINKAGGVGTQEGKMQAVKEWQTNMDKPTFGRFIVGLLAGEPNAYKHLTGGVATTKYTYGDNGQMIRYKEDEVGDRFDAVNMATGQSISPTEFANLNAGALGEALTKEKKSQEQKFSVDENLAEGKKIEGYQAFAPIMRRFADEKQQLSKELIGSGLNADQVSYYLSFGKQKVSNSESLSNAANQMGQLSEGKTKSLSEQDTFGLKAALKPFGFGIGADGKVVNTKGEEASKTELKQLQNILSQSAQKELSFDRTSEQAALGALFGPLSSQQQDRILRLRELNDSFEKKMGEMRSTYGAIPFLVETEPFSALTSPNRFSAQADVLRHNANIIDKYASNRAEQLKVFDSAGQVPKPGQIMSAFTKTAAYDESEKELKQSIRKSLSEKLIPATNTGVNSGVPSVTAEAGVGRAAMANPTKINEVAKKNAPSLPKASDVINRIINPAR
jgi:hypothetical protein